MKRGPTTLTENNAKRPKITDSEDYINWLLDPKLTIEKNSDIYSDIMVSLEEAFNLIDETVSHNTDPLPLPAQKDEPTHTIKKLMTVIRRKNTNMVKSILQNPANHPLVNMTDKEGKTPLMVALQIVGGRGHGTILAELLKAGANPMISCEVKKDGIEKPMSPYHYVQEIIARQEISSPRYTAYEKYLPLLNKVDGAPTHTITQLIRAIRVKSTNMVKSILQDPTNHPLVNMTDKEGKTPLMVALQIVEGRGHGTILAELLKAGANPMISCEVKKDGIEKPMSPYHYVQEIIARQEIISPQYGAYLKHRLLFNSHLNIPGLVANKESHSSEIPSESNLLEFFTDTKLDSLLLNFETIDESESHATSVDWFSPIPTLNWKNTSGHNIDTQTPENEEVLLQEFFKNSTNFKY